MSRIVFHRGGVARGGAAAVAMRTATAASAASLTSGAAVRPSCFVGRSSGSSDGSRCSLEADPEAGYRLSSGAPLRLSRASSDLAMGVGSPRVSISFNLLGSWAELTDTCA